MKIKEVKVVEVLTSIGDDNFINRACMVCNKNPWYVHHATTVDEMYKRLFSVHGALDSKCGGDRLCEILETLKEYTGKGYTIADRM